MDDRGDRTFWEGFKLFWQPLIEHPFLVIGFAALFGILMTLLTGGKCPHEFFGIPCPFE
jgi:hypothetical protein